MVFLHYQINQLKNTIMKNAALRFRTLEVVSYRKSNTTREVSFNTLEEALDFARDQRAKHPRTNKLHGVVRDSVTGEYHRI